jgi:hypothetical protein
MVDYVLISKSTQLGPTRLPDSKPQFTREACDVKLAPVEAYPHKRSRLETSSSGFHPFDPFFTPQKNPIAFLTTHLIQVVAEGDILKRKTADRRTSRF